MRIPRLRWPAATDAAITGYNVYRWRGTRPAVPSRIMNVGLIQKSITIRLPLTRAANDWWRLPFDPGPNGLTALYIDGLAATMANRQEALVQLTPTPEVWQLVEAVITITGVETLDGSLSQTSVIYYGPEPADLTIAVDLHDLVETPLTSERPGYVRLTWEEDIQTGGGTFYTYEVRAIGAGGVESLPSPIAQVRFSGLRNLRYLIERSEDAVAWASAGIVSARTFDLSATTTLPSSLTGVTQSLVRDETAGTATIQFGWNALPASRAVNSSRYRTRPLIDLTPVGAYSEQVGPLPLSIPLEGVQIRLAIGATPTPTGPGGSTVALVTGTSSPVVITDNFKTIRIGLFVRDAAGLFSIPVIAEVVTGDLHDPLDPVTVTML